MVMPRNVTVQFSDGTSHVYEDVPDEIHDSEVNARATSQFGKDVSNVQNETQQKQDQSPTIGTALVGGAQTGANMIGQALGHPLVQHGLELAAGKKFIVDPILKSMNNRPGMTPSAPVAPTTPVNPAAGESMLNPTWDAALKQPIKQPSIIDQGMQYAKQGLARAHAVGDIAMQKVMQNAGNIGRAGVGIGALTYSQGLNPNEQAELQRRQQVPFQPYSR